ncbi:Basic-leucine zipper (bZIP) transcription factor family protein [Rhynchospora pubera]|uniref:Basic-leucine zipper (BZIP) transcription factor family protein n=1 Tax=Rhynchospora pubera TaxID=906938 RepID=A0AAV8F2A1_9POAL|nr:Basic-leucine zipper (bZIP) transcription factor family protein [Rhynchospora pubera]
MAERPPKVPVFHLQATPTTELNPKNAIPLVAPPPDTPPWANKFSDFCRVKRAAHRGDAIESSLSMDDPEFDRLDEEFLLSMFPENRGQTSISNTIPEISENNSNNTCEVDKKELDEEDSSEYKLETDVLTGGTQIEASSPPEVTSPMDNEGAPTTDPKRVKRILANRQSAQRSRVRKLHYISELERNVQLLQNEVDALTPRVAYLDHQRTLLTMSNGHLRQKVATLTQDGIFKKNQYDVLLKEKERLNNLLQQQQQNVQKIIIPDDDLDADLDAESIAVESSGEKDLPKHS